MIKIRFKTRIIGDFSDGSLVFNKKTIPLVHAAVIQFETKEDAQAFAKTVTFNYSDLDIEASAPHSQPGATS